MPERKRVTLHPLLSDGSSDLDVNLYPKTFLDGIVDREGNEVEVATAEELEQKADKEETDIVGAQTYSYSLNARNGLTISHKSKSNISKGTAYQSDGIVNTFSKPGTQEENHLSFPSKSGTIAIAENTLPSYEPNYEHTIDDAYAEYASHGSSFIISGEIIIKLYPLIYHEGHYDMWIWRKEGYAAVLDIDGGYNFIDTIENANYTEYADKQNYLSKVQGSRVWEMSDNFYSPEAYTSEMKSGDIIIDPDTENLAIIRNIGVENNQLQYLLMYGFGSGDKPTKYSYESSYDFIQAEVVGGGTQLYRHFTHVSYLNPSGHQTGMRLYIISNKSSRYDNISLIQIVNRDFPQMFIEDQSQDVPLKVAFSSQSSEGQIMIFDASVSGNINVFSGSEFYCTDINDPVRL